MKVHLLIPAAALIGCGNGTLTSAVFADDGQGALVAEQDFKDKSGCVTPDNCLSDSSGLLGARLFLGDIEDDRVVISEEIADVADLRPFVYGNFAFVSSQGYVMYTEDSRTVVIHHLAGPRVRLDPPPGQAEGSFPSLDGTLIAQVGFDAGQAEVRFFDPTDGRLIEAQVAPMRKGPLPEAGRGAVVWTAEGLGVWGAVNEAAPAELGAYLFRPGTMPELRQSLPCAAPTPSFAIRGGVSLPDAEEIDGDVQVSMTTASDCSKSPKFPARPLPTP